MGRRGKFPSGQSLLEYARRLGIGISSVCGGKGVCGKCKVQLLNGCVTAPRDHETRAFSPAQLAADRCVREAMNMGLRRCVIHLKGPGPGREAAIRSIHATGVEVTGVKDKTSMPHNGCRPKKRRRM